MENNIYTITSINSEIRFDSKSQNKNYNQQQQMNLNKFTELYFNFYSTLFLMNPIFLSISLTISYIKKLNQSFKNEIKAANDEEYYPQKKNLELIISS